MCPRERHLRYKNSKIEKCPREQISELKNVHENKSQIIKIITNLHKSARGQCRRRHHPVPQRHRGRQQLQALLLRQGLHGGGHNRSYLSASLFLHTSTTAASSPLPR